MKNNLKKYGIIILTLVLVLSLGANVLGTDTEVMQESLELSIDVEGHSSLEAPSAEETEEIEKEEEEEKEEKNENNEDIKNEESTKMNETSETIIGSKDRKTERINELTDKYNDRVMGHVAYYLELLQKYSFPICFIGLAMGAFNFLIIGNKKLDKREQGFAWIVGFTIGLVVFNVIPLLFALIVAGR